ncbi:hypothetical protein TKK_0017797 [Trichogramma kaykai]|uniref:Uncharacterized protein n=1 Tax=Trichogramma kaykai TaxID=54128 RepID=A0ABD2W214_9HYME
MKQETCDLSPNAGYNENKTDNSYLDAAEVKCELECHDEKPNLALLSSTVLPVGSQHFLPNVKLEKGIKIEKVEKELIILIKKGFCYDNNQCKDEHISYTKVPSSKRKYGKRNFIPCEK